VFHDRNIARAEDRAYYRRRAAEESERAERALTPAAKQAHSALAAIFERKAEAESVGAEARLPE
jgi:hypothetical protein